MMNIVYINEEGKFLRVHETSSHSPERLYGHDWVELNRATVFSRCGEFEKLKFKSLAPVSVCSLKVEETRTLKIIGDE